MEALKSSFWDIMYAMFGVLIFAMASWALFHFIIEDWYTARKYRGLNLLSPSKLTNKNFATFTTMIMGYLAEISEYIENENINLRLVTYLVDMKVYGLCDIIEECGVIELSSTIEITAVKIVQDAVVEALKLMYSNATTYRSFDEIIRDTSTSIGEFIANKPESYSMDELYDAVMSLKYSQ